MNKPPPVQPRLRLPLYVWAVGVLAASAAALTAWALTSRADAPATANPAAATHPDMHYNFMGFADLEQGVAPLYPLQPGRVVKVFAHDGDEVEADAPLFTMDDKMAMQQIDAAEADLRDAELQLEEAQKLVGPARGANRRPEAGGGSAQAGGRRRPGQGGRGGTAARRAERQRRNDSRGGPPG